MSHRSRRGVDGTGLFLIATSEVGRNRHNSPVSGMETKQVTTRLQRQPRTLQLVLLSDTHEQHREVDVPCGDIVIHSGDFTQFSRSLNSIIDFNEWLGALPHRHKIVIPGNHEFFLEADPSRRSLLSNATVLINEATEIEGLRIWGSPVTPLYGGAFGRSSAEDRRRLYAGIPRGTDVVITHGPPFGILDSGSGSEHHQGDPVLFAAVTRIRPKLHVFGHVHLDKRSPRIFDTEDTIFVNAALLGPDGAIDRPPILLRIDRQ
jgi:Icc-related predicted phosphoesterase